MSGDFSAFKAMAWGMGAMFVVASVAPDMTGGRFDPLRLTKSRDAIVADFAGLKLKH